MKKGANSYNIHRYSCDILAGPQLDTTEVARVLTEEASDKLIIVNNLRMLLDFFPTSGFNFNLFFF